MLKKSKAFVWHARMHKKLNKYCVFFNRFGKLKRTHVQRINKEIPFSTGNISRGHFSIYVPNPGTTDPWINEGVV